MTHATIVAAILAFTTPARVDPDMLATELESYKPEWVAIQLTVGIHESALQQRIADGHCRPFECDRGRAWGMFQEHKNTRNAAVWGSIDIGAQVSSAHEGLRRAYFTCARFYSAEDWVGHTLNAYAGKRCDAWWPGLDARLATYKKVRRILG